MKKAEKLLTVKQVSEMIALSISTIYAGRAGTDKLKRFNLQPDERSGVPPSEVTRLPPLRGAARFYYSAAPSGFRKVGW